jgi:hypothetical protein
VPDKARASRKQARPKDAVTISRPFSRPRLDRPACAPACAHSPFVPDRRRGAGAPVARTDARQSDLPARRSQPAPWAPDRRSNCRLRDSQCHSYDS